MTDIALDSIEDAIAEFAKGEIVIVVDDEDRENEGDLIIAAEALTPEKMAFMVRHTSGVVCCAVTDERADDLYLRLMVRTNTEAQGTAFTVSVDLREGTSTGISAADRALTCNALADPSYGPEDFARPGHIFPLRARPGGVLKRAGHTEAAVDLTTMAGRAPVGALCEIVSADGSMSRLPELIEFAKEHDMPIISIADMIRYRNRTEKIVDRFATARMPTPWGEFQVHAFRSKLDEVEHVAYVMGDLNDDSGAEAAPLVRVHSECLTGDIFHSLRCDCGAQLENSLARIAESGRGALVYLRGHEGRGIGLGHKLRAYALQDEGMDTVDANLALGFQADSREYGIGAQILSDLGISKMRLLTNNPAKYGGLEGFDLEIVERVSIEGETTEENRRYLETKRDRLGHMIDPSAQE